MPGSATFGRRVDAASLLGQTEYETGLHDFGSAEFRGSLGAFAGFLSSPGLLGDDDRRAAFGQMVRVLSGRLRLVADRKRYPGIADERIEAPLIVVGFPRSGTTLLHALLAAAPGHRAPLYWGGRPPVVATVAGSTRGSADRRGNPGHRALAGRLPRLHRPAPVLRRWRRDAHGVRVVAGV